VPTSRPPECWRSGWRGPVARFVAGWGGGSWWGFRSMSLLAARSSTVSSHMGNALRTFTLPRRHPRSRQDIAGRCSLHPRTMKSRIHCFRALSMPELTSPLVATRSPRLSMWPASRSAAKTGVGPLKRFRVSQHVGQGGALVSIALPICPERTPPARDSRLRDLRTEHRRPPPWSVLRVGPVVVVRRRRVGGCGARGNADPGAPSPVRSRCRAYRLRRLPMGWAARAIARPLPQHGSRVVDPGVHRGRSALHLPPPLRRWFSFRSAGCRSPSCSG